jgi:hypothetical protein
MEGEEEDDPSDIEADKTDPLANLVRRPTDPDEKSEDGTDVLPTQIFGSDNLKRLITALCREFKHIFSRELRTTPAKLEPLILEVNEAEWFTKKNRTPPRPQGKVKNAEIRRQIEKMLKAGVIRVSQATAYSHVHLVPKADGTWRFCIDFRSLNALTKALGFPIPNIDRMIERLGSERAKFYAIMDLTKGYYQGVIAEASRRYTAFITEHGLYEWVRVAMGLTSAPSYFQEQMQNVVLAGLLYSICEVYLDDIIVHAQTEEQFIDRLRKIFQRLSDNGITLNPDKCRLGLEEVEFVGHVINSEGHTFSREKVSAVLNFEKPQTAQEMKSFLGTINYFRGHIRNYAVITQPLHKLILNYTKKDRNTPVQWTMEAEAAFVQVKGEINNLPTMYFLREEGEIRLYTDASNLGIGGYLCQVETRPDGTEIERPTAFMSEAFKGAQLRWSTYEQEAYAIYKSVTKFEYLLRGRRFSIFTDHRNLTFISKTGSKKVTNWRLAIQEFDFTVHSIKGEDNVIADQLSRYQEIEGGRRYIHLNQLTVEPNHHAVIELCHNSYVGHHV